ncbi:helix-turn-helix domain-containing protein [Leeia sp.]|uniref:helix-turn-helix domain-containing protein n=1 Tax=Leeia sp. TaxID=2884678 RepID=UPI0035B4A2CE
MNLAQIGLRIRRRRREIKKTLQTVADESGLSVGFLSQVERNLTGISLSSLVNVAKSLGMPLRSLLDQPAQTEPDSHEGQRQVYSVGNSAQRYERLSSTFPGSALNATRLHYPAGYRSETVSHDGDEFVYVLSGSLQYSVAGQTYLLQAGDSLHFDAHKPHDIANVGSVEAEAIIIGTLALFDDAQAD